MIETNLRLDKFDSTTPRTIFEELDKYVIGQERAKRVVAIAAYNHLKRVRNWHSPQGRLLKKSNVLMIGPTGCGKTHIARNLARILDLPFIVADITEYTEAGYYGKDVEVMVGELLHKTDLNVNAAERGIIFIDEIDKIARRSHGARTGAGARDIGGEGVQQGLLKLLEGRKLYVPLNVTQHWNKHDFAEIDTSNILFICAGTFSDLRVNASSAIGFERESGTGADEVKISHKDLLDYGLIPELLGRLPVNVRLDELNGGDLVKIMTLPPDSILKEYVQLLALDEIQLEFSPDAIKNVADFSVEKKLGARGLRAIIEEVMHDIMFDAPDKKPERIVVTGEYVREKLESFDSSVVGK